MQTESSLIFINNKAKHIDDLFENNIWELKKLYAQVYTLFIDGKESNWVVKIHSAQKYTKREAETIQLLQSINTQEYGVPKMLAYGTSDDLNYIIISKEKGLDLCDYIRKHTMFSEKVTKDIIKKTLTILKVCHKNSIIHKDIKPENIIYDEKTSKVTLIDFEGKCTAGYKSPEQCKKIALTNKTDIWSVGCTLYVLLMGRVPFRNDKETLEKPILLKKTWDKNLKDFLTCCLEREVLLRHTAEELLNHSWLVTL